MDQNLKSAAVSDSLNCKNCGAVLHFVPGTHALKCDYCGVSNTIDKTDEACVSVDYEKFITDTQAYQNTAELQVVNCKGCGSQTVLQQNITADKCPFCASPLVLELAANRQILKPHYVLPFIVDRNKAGEYFQSWLKGLWFAPGDLRKKVNSAGSSPLQGVYMPYWTYDTDTVTNYTGQRGEYYYTTESYTVTVNGRQETRTRQVRHTRWYSASGRVFVPFTDVTVPSSRSLPDKTLITLGPWNFDQLVRFDERYLSGFRSETFQVSPQDGLNVAKSMMVPQIESAINNDIGGDEQRIDDYQSQYNNLAIKYVMLPVWVSSYKYNDKVYQFTINACTGEVIGQRPLSWIKITLAILLVLIIIAVIVLFANGNQ